MGKYMKKSKITGDVALMEVSQPSMGVRTRAKTLALLRLQKTSSPPNPDASSYLQLRSRRLEKPPSPLLNDTSTTKKVSKDSCRENPNPNPNSNPNTGMSSRFRLSSVNSGSVGSFSLSCSKNDDGYYSKMTMVGNEGETEEFNDVGFEASFAENNLEFEGRERGSRESTPCSLIRDPDAIGTPGSSTRPTSSTATHRIIRNAVQRNIPTTWEMEEFFACAERQQQRLFTEKYNFDIVNDLPLPGRYEWVSVNP